MANPGQPTVQLGDEGDAVRRAQRGVRRGLPDPSLTVDGIFGPVTESVVKMFQEGVDLPADGDVGEQTWDASTGGMMHTLETSVGLRYVTD